MYLGLLTAMLSSGCAAIPSSDESLLTAYSPPFQERVLEELRSQPLRSCKVNEVGGKCSAIKTMINDYLQLRDKLRVR